jgi:uncharacterized membrane protein YkvA (DUF1232 family)
MFALARVLPPGRAKELIGFAPNCVILLRRLGADTDLPWRVRAVLGLALAYVVSPVQLIPNVIPVVGQSDDMTVVALALRLACRRSRSRRWRPHGRGTWSTCASC